MQSLAERCEAIVSLLPLLEIEIQPETDGDGGEDACPNDCHTCTVVCTDELWYVIWKRLRRAYPLGALEYLLEKLDVAHWTWRWAVHYTWVQPWSDFDPERRAEWAREGVAWLADEWEKRWPHWSIRKYLIPGMEREPTREERIEDMLTRGFTWQRICRELGCSKREISAVARARMERPRSTASAGG